MVEYFRRDLCPIKSLNLQFLIFDFVLKYYQSMPLFKLGIKHTEFKKNFNKKKNL